MLNFIVQEGIFVLGRMHCCFIKTSQNTSLTWLTLQEENIKTEEKGRCWELKCECSYCTLLNFTLFRSYLNHTCCICMISWRQILWHFCALPTVSTLFNINYFFSSQACKCKSFHRLFKNRLTLLPQLPSPSVEVACPPGWALGAGRPRRLHLDRRPGSKAPDSPRNREHRPDRRCGSGNIEPCCHVWAKITEELLLFHEQRFLYIVMFMLITHFRVGHLTATVALRCINHQMALAV